MKYPRLGPICGTLVPPLPSIVGCFGEDNLPCHVSAPGVLRRGTLWQGTETHEVPS